MSRKYEWWVGDNRNGPSCLQKLCQNGTNRFWAATAKYRACQRTAVRPHSLALAVMLTNTDNVFRNTTISANTVSCFPFPERNNNKYLFASSPQIQTKLVRKLLANNICRSVLSLYTHPARSGTLQSQLGNSDVRSLHPFCQRRLRFLFNWSRFCVDSTPWKSTFQGLTCCWGSWKGGPNPDWHTGAKVRVLVAILRTAVRPYLATQQITSPATELRTSGWAVHLQRLLLAHIVKKLSPVITLSIKSSHWSLSSAGPYFGPLRRLFAAKTLLALLISLTGSTCPAHRNSLHLSTRYLSGGRKLLKLFLSIFLYSGIPLSGVLHFHNTILNTHNIFKCYPPPQTRDHRHSIPVSQTTRDIPPTPWVTNTSPANSNTVPPHMMKKKDASHVKQTPCTNMCDEWWQSSSHSRPCNWKVVVRFTTWPYNFDRRGCWSQSGTQKLRERERERCCILNLT